LTEDSKPKIYRSYVLLSKIKIDDVKDRSRSQATWASFSGKNILHKNKLWNEKLKVLEQLLQGNINEQNYFSKTQFHLLSPEWKKVD